VAIKFKYTPAVEFTDNTTMTKRLSQFGKEYNFAIEIGHSVLQVRPRPRRRLDTCAIELENWTLDVARIACFLFEAIFQGVKMQVDHGLLL
jgi:hypothetical protein